MDSNAVEVVAAGSAGEVGAPPPAPAPEDAPAVTGRPVSPLELLRGKREELISQLYKDLVVPRWDAVLEGHRLWVRYRPGDPGVLNAAIERRGAPKDKPADWFVAANADYLVAACVAVFILPVGSRPDASLDGEDLPRFGDPGLAEVLGVVARDASKVCRAVYATDGDLLAAAVTVAEWSGTTIPEVDGDFLPS